MLVPAAVCVLMFAVVVIVGVIVGVSDYVVVVRVCVVAAFVSVDVCLFLMWLL